jgi:hypothetical protein
MSVATDVQQQFDWRLTAFGGGGRRIAARTSGLSADSKMTPFELARCLC